MFSVIGVDGLLVTFKALGHEFKFDMGSFRSWVPSLTWDQNIRCPNEPDEFNTHKAADFLLLEERRWSRDDPNYY